jgi:hypothetical protein
MRGQHGFERDERPAIVSRLVLNQVETSGRRSGGASRIPLDGCVTSVMIFACSSIPVVAAFIVPQGVI